MMLSKSAVTSLFDQPQPVAAFCLGVSLSVLKKACRKFEIEHSTICSKGRSSKREGVGKRMKKARTSRWPYQRRLAADAIVQHAA